MASFALGCVTSELGLDSSERMQQMPDDAKILARSIDVRLMPTHSEDLLIIANAKGG